MKNTLKKWSTILATTLFLTGSQKLSAQQSFELPLWPDGAPYPNEVTGKEKMDSNGHIYNISTATLTVYIPESSNGKAIMACPGGGYYLISSHHEGHHFAKWLNEQGIVYAVLKYHLPNGNGQIPLQDAQKALQLLHQHANEWGIKKIGVMGFSAGGHLASTIATHFKNELRPDFQILFYPVISLQKEITHSGTRDSFLGKSPTQDMVDAYSNELQVTAQTPPAFLLHCSDDPAVPVANSLRYYEALLQHQVPATLHCYPKGGHGWGCKDNFPYKNEWMIELSRWLKEL